MWAVEGFGTRHSEFRPFVAHHRGPRWPNLGCGRAETGPAVVQNNVFARRLSRTAFVVDHGNWTHNVLGPPNRPNGPRVTAGTPSRIASLRGLCHFSARYGDTI